MMIDGRNDIRRRAVALFVTALVLTGAIGCGDDGECCTTPSSNAAAPAYAGKGPYPVGVTTLQLSDRKVEVWYPAVPGSETGLAHDTYNQTDPLTDPILLSLATNIARREHINLIYETRAYRNLAPSRSGPFPVILFSHGFGGWRDANSSLVAGIASWGFVVASADYLERGLNAVATSTVAASAEKDRAITLDTLALLRGKNAEAGGLLAGLMNFDHIAAAGHSAGGHTALDVLSEPEIDVAVGYAAAGGGTNGGKPAMLIAAREDIGVTTASTETLFASLSTPKRLAIIERAGHNSFSDTCAAIRDGASLAQLASEAGLQIDERLLALAANGCDAANLSPDSTWSISQHFTVAQLRAAFGIDKTPVGLGAGVANAFEVPVEYRIQ